MKLPHACWKDSGRSRSTPWLWPPAESDLQYDSICSSGQLHSFIGQWALGNLAGLRCSLRLSFTVCLDLTWLKTSSRPITYIPIMRPASSPCRRRWWMRLFLALAPVQFPTSTFHCMNSRESAILPPERSNPTRTDFSLNCNPRSSFLLGLSDRLYITAS